MSQYNQEFVFTWTIENYCFCYTKYVICSPYFLPSDSHKNKYFLSLYPRGHDDSSDYVSVELDRYSCEENEELVTINFKIELSSSNDEVFASVEKKNTKFESFAQYFIRDFIRIEKLEREIKNSAKDSLIVRCRMFMQKNVINASPSKRSCSIITEIGFNMFSFPWKVHLSQFSDYPNHTVTKIVSINEETQFGINLKSHKDDYSFEIKQVSQKKNPFLPVKCEIALLNVIDIEKISRCGFFTFKEESNTWLFPPFLKNSLLEEDSLIYRALDLRFNFKISNGLSISKYIDDTKLLNSPELSSLKDDLRAMLLNRRHTDVSFRIESEIISAHKCILASRSPVFSAMFNQEMVENQTGVIDVSDISKDTLRLFLEFLYTEVVEDLKWERALDLLLVAEKYQVFSLKEKCSEFLKNSLNTDNICDVVSVADMVGHQNLKTAAMDYIKENSTEVLGSPKWLKWIKKNVELCSEIFYSLSQEFKTIQKKV